MREIIISKSEDGEKLKKLCFKYFDKAPQSFTYKMLRKKNITLNGRKADADAVLHTGDSVKLFLSDETIELFHTERSAKKTSDINTSNNSKRFQLNSDNIVYECDDYIIINKPAGVLSQKSSNDDYSVNEAVIDYMLSKGDITEESLNVFRPSVCNRLDRNTSGIITAGKTLKGLRYLSDSLGAKSDSGADKKYLTIVHGEYKKNGIIELYYKKDEALNKAVVSDTNMTDAVKIKTGFRCISYNISKDLSLVECTLYTGKSHQIRVTLEYLGFPVVGDIKYGNRLQDRRLSPRPKRQMLHAYMLRLSETEQFTAYVPEDMNGYMEFKGTQGLNL